MSIDPPQSPPGGLSHFNESGAAHMVDVGEKPVSKRIAVASAIVRMQPETAATIREGRAGKGDVIGIARIAGIMAAKRTGELIPLCHPLPITHVDIDIEPGKDHIAIRARVETRSQTGVEMEAMTAATVTALTIYDMTKGIDRGMTIEDVRLELKEGGRSGRWERTDE